MVYYSLTEYFEGKRISLVILYVLFCLILLLNFSIVEGFLSGSSHFSAPYGHYYQNPYIIKISLIYLFCTGIIFIIFLAEILRELKIINLKIPRVIVISVLLVCSCAVIAFTWYELYIGSTFDYPNRDKHGLASFLLFPSSYLAMVISVLLANRLKYGSILFFIFGSCSCIIYKIQLSIFVQYFDSSQIFYP